MTDPTKILALKDLKKHYPIMGGVLRRQVNSVKALDGINIDIYRGECLGVVGESGCGKTTTAKTIIGLEDATHGKIQYFPNGGNEKTLPLDIAAMGKRGLKKSGIRAKLQMVFQDPTTSLDPRMLIKNIIAEPILALQRVGSRDLEARVLELLRYGRVDQRSLPALSARIFRRSTPANCSGPGHRHKPRVSHPG